LKFLIDKKNVFLLWRYIQNSLSPWASRRVN
jgi:hypothetical protein